jgi:LPXTG-site transpeptidase (sortase) family protein
VVEGTDEADLQKGPGHYTGSALPGQHGNSAIAGHRTTYGAPFNRLDNLVPGDTVVATTPNGAFLYVVTAKMVVAPSQSSVVEDYGDDRMTLTTCTPEFLATQRLVVVARLMGAISTSPPAKTSTPPALTTHRPPGSNSAVLANLRQASTRNFNWSALLPTVLGGLIVATLGLLWRPIRRRLPALASVAVLSPLWSAALLLVFEQANRFLPPNV